jgi:hypothetical protein
MLIIGCDFQARYQEIAMTREETAWLLVERRLDHESGKVFAANGSQKLASLVASECDEVEVVAADDAFEVVRHKEEAEQEQSKSRGRTQSPPLHETKSQG